MSKATKPKRLILVGLPKSGTTTVHRALEASGYESAHYKWKGKLVGSLIYQAQARGADPLEDLPECITQMDACSEVDAANLWPQCDIDLLQSILATHKQAILLLTTRKPDDHARSLMQWKDYAPRLTRAEIPGLPAGQGGKVNELREWVRWHNIRIRTTFGSHSRFVDVNIASPSAPDLIGRALGHKLAWWGIANANNGLVISEAVEQRARADFYHRHPDGSWADLEDHKKAEWRQQAAQA